MVEDIVYMIFGWRSECGARFVRVIGRTKTTYLKISICPSIITVRSHGPNWTIGDQHAGFMSKHHRPLTSYPTIPYYKDSASMSQINDETFCFTIPGRHENQS